MSITTPPHFRFFFFFLMSLGFYRIQTWRNSSSHQRILTNDKVTEAEIDDRRGEVFLFSTNAQRKRCERRTEENILKWWLKCSSPHSALRVLLKSPPPGRGSREKEHENQKVKSLLRRSCTFFKCRSLEIERRFSMVVYLFILLLSAFHRG